MENAEKKTEKDPWLGKIGKEILVGYLLGKAVQISFHLAVKYLRNSITAKKTEEED